MTKIRNLFLLIVVLVVAAVGLQAVKGGGGSASGNQGRQTDTYRIKIDYKNVRYVVDFAILVANKRYEPYPTKLDAQGTNGIPIEPTGQWTMDVIYRKGTGGILIDLDVSSGNPAETLAHCTIVRMRGGAEIEVVSGPYAADRKHGTSCTYDDTWLDDLIG